MANLGFIGLGVMGSELVDRLLSKGHSVVGYNRTRSKAEWLVKKGMKWGDSPRAVAAAFRRRRSRARSRSLPHRAALWFDTDSTAECFERVAAARVIHEIRNVFPHEQSKRIARLAALRERSVKSRELP